MNGFPDATIQNSATVNGAVACPQCRSLMRLVGIEPHPKPQVNSEIFTYECACGHFLVDTIETH